MSTALAIRDVVKTFAGLRALGGVSADLEAGSVVGLIGPNGSGKTTLLNCVSGLYAPDAGTIALGGEDVTPLRGDEIARRGLRRTFQHPLIVREMTVLENVLVGAHVNVDRGVLRAALGVRSRADREARERGLELLRWLGIERIAPMRCDQIAGPVLKLVELARALVADPTVLLLDEVAAGLNSAEKDELSARVAELRDDRGLAVVLVEHDLDFVMGLAQHVVVLDSGRVIAAGTPAEVQRSPEVISAYTG